MARLVHTFGKRTLLLVGGLALLPLFLLALPAGAPTLSPAAHARVAAEEASQERDLPTTEPVLRQRLQQQTRLGVPTWHTAGHRGRGVKVAILDSGFRGYRAHLGQALPAQVVARSFRKDGNLEAKDSQHGILCGEVVHALAPEAELLLANWEPDQPDSFLQAVRWARQEGARVVSCSCIMPHWSDGEGGGAIHDELGRILGTGRGQNDPLLFACAGNTAMRHWHGSFRPSGDGFHEWQSGRIDNRLSPWGTERVSVELYCPAGATYEVRILDAQKNEVARSRTSTAADRCVAVARFLAVADRNYDVRVRLVTGPPNKFHLVALHSGLSYGTVGGSICFPGDGRTVVAVGAVNAEDQRCSYSACGPNSALPKPDLVAPVPFASQWRAKPFAGTSAATPQAAALAALWWSRYPDWTADRIRTSMHRSARDLGPVGHDYETGYGRVRLP